MRLTGRVVAVLMVAGPTGCKPDGRSGEAEPPAEASQADRLDRLRSLPYVGYVSEEADEDRAGVVHFDEQRSCPGYSLYTSRPLCRADLIDMTGRVVRSWHRPGKHWARAVLLPDGELLVVGADLPDAPGQVLDDELRYLMRLSWDNRVLWKRKMPAHHDVGVTPRNQIVTLVLEYRRVPEVNPELDIRDDNLSLLAPDGTPLESRSLYDALASRPDLFTFQPVAPQHKWGRDMIDLFHSNSIEWMHHRHLERKHPLYSSDNVIVCIRHQDTVAVINWKTRELVWTWGQGQILGPHDATVLENGHILLFDNGLGRDWSRVLELDPLTEKIVWEYRAPEPTDFYTASRGTNQRLPNGNTLIANSDNGHAFEITPEGQIVWEFFNPHRNWKGQRATIVWMKRYEPDYIERVFTEHGMATVDQGPA